MICVHKFPVWYWRESSVRTRDPGHWMTKKHFIMTWNDELLLHESESQAQSNRWSSWVIQLSDPVEYSCFRLKECIWHRIGLWFWTTIMYSRLKMIKGGWTHCNAERLRTWLNMIHGRGVTGRNDNRLMVWVASARAVQRTISWRIWTLHLGSLKRMEICECLGKVIKL